MIVTCPECATRYDVDDAAFSNGGRAVRCNHCGCEWYQIGPSHLTAVTAPEPAATATATATATDVEPIDAEPAEAIREFDAEEVFTPPPAAAAPGFESGPVGATEGSSTPTFSDGGSADFAPGASLPSGAAASLHYAATDADDASELIDEDGLDPTDPDSIAEAPSSDGPPAAPPRIETPALAPPTAAPPATSSFAPTATPSAETSTPAQSARPQLAPPPSARAPELRSAPPAPAFAPRRPPSSAPAAEQQRLALGRVDAGSRDRRPVLRTRPEEPAAQARVAAPAQASTPTAAAAAPATADPTEARRPAGPAEKRQGRRRATRFVAASAAVLGLFGAYGYSEEIGAAAPFAAPALDAYRSQVDLILTGAPSMMGVEEGLVFIEARYDLVDRPEGPALEVWGRVANNGPDVAFTPTIEIVSRDENGEQLQTWSTRLEDGRLEVGEESRFSSRMMFPDGPVYDVDFYIVNP